MPIYKQLPSLSKSQDLPFYRPLDNLLIKIADKKGWIISVIIGIVLVILAYAGIKAYVSYYENKAATSLAAGELESVIAHYPRANAAMVARMKLAKKALDEEKWGEAITWSTPVAESSHAPAVLKVAALHNKAFASMKKGDNDHAIEFLNIASKLKENPIQEYSQFLLAYVYEVKGEKEKASVIYKELSESSVIPQVREEAGSRLSWLTKN